MRLRAFTRITFARLWAPWHDGAMFILRTFSSTPTEGLGSFFLFGFLLSLFCVARITATRVAMDILDQKEDLVTSQRRAWSHLSIVPMQRAQWQCEQSVTLMKRLSSYPCVLTSSATAWHSSTATPAPESTSIHMRCVSLKRSFSLFTSANMT